MRSGGRVPGTVDLVADPMRREILRRIWDTELQVGALVAAFDVSQPAISFRLGLGLREGGLVRVRPQGNQRYYRAVPEALGELRTYLESYWQDRLSRRFFTEPALLERWLCAQAEIDARPGGGYVFNVTGSHTTRGTFLVVEPSRRLVHTWLFDHVAPPLRTTVEVTLTPVGRATRVRLHHHGFVDRPARDRHAAGWAHYLPRLAVAAAGRENRERTSGAPNCLRLPKRDSAGY